MLQDPNLPIICDGIAEKIPAKSIYLCGSRATGQGITESSDYDLGIVINTFLIPLYLGRLKRLERELSQKLRLDLVINPLPTFRIHRAKGNLFLFKLKREGITLWGQDYIKSLDAGEIRDIDVDWHFSYLFSAMKDLVQDFEPGFISTNTDAQRSKRLIRNAAKAILYCGEIHLLVNGYYETRIDDMISRLSSLNYPPKSRAQFLEDLKLSSDIRTGSIGRIEDPLGFWFRAKGHLLDTFQILMQNFWCVNSNSLDELAIQYLSKSNKSLKNLQYLALTWLLRKEIFGKALWSRCSVEDKIRMGLLWLLCSINEQGHITRRPLAQAYDALKGYINIPYSDDNVTFWRNIKSSIITYWPFACAVMGL
ncbi:hypothetical protein ES707_15023 [subsurface metagenome]